MATRVGVSRVTDTTRLDTIGIPVFASIRPTAVDGSLCVNAGKGVRLIEAEVGAYMEAIECAVAEPIRQHRAIFAAEPNEVLGGGQSRAILADFCPIHGIEMPLAGPIDCVSAEDLVTRSEVLVPAELVFLPYTPRHGGAIFGTSSNGLASGNTVAEATLHGLLEVIERDITSFHYVLDTSKCLLGDTVPDVSREQIEKIRTAGLDICIREMPNVFRIPTFSAEILDAGSVGPVGISGGFGCHTLPEVALIRAITEAVQSRLTAIHGGRDDLERPEARISHLEAGDEEEVAFSRFQSLQASSDRAHFDANAGMRAPTSIEDALGDVIDRLLECGIRHVCRIILTAPDEEVCVVRVIVPKLEYFEPHFPRIGPRLLNYMHGQVT